MKEQIRVIVKTPNERVGHIEVIKNELKSFQTLVGGCIEAVTLKDNPQDEWFAVICNEEGLINNMPINCNIAGFTFFGNIIAAGVDGEEFTDVPMDLEGWKNFMDWR